MLRSDEWLRAAPPVVRPVPENYFLSFSASTVLSSFPLLCNTLGSVVVTVGGKRPQSSHDSGLVGAVDDRNQINLPFSPWLFFIEMLLHRLLSRLT